MIKIEVTGGSIGEVADKLLSIGASLLGSGVPSQPIKVDPVMPEVAEMATSPEPVTAATETVSSPGTTATAQPQPSESNETAKNTDASSASSGSDELDFDTDVAPFVLQVVKEKGKPVAQEILSQFGVEKASNLDPAQWPELVEALKGAL